MKVGSVHGRFQPFHNGHLKYVLAAHNLCEYLWIGITKCDVGLADRGMPIRFRDRPENNPLTFFERLEIIRESLVDAGVDRARFGFLPFPIETPETLPSFLPTYIPCYTTICEKWNEDKIEILKKLGYSVIVLYREQPKEISGSAIRADIVDGGDFWRTLVPPAAARAADRLDLRNRLIEMRRTDGVVPPVTTHGAPPAGA